MRSGLIRLPMALRSARRTRPRRVHPAQGLSEDIVGQPVVERTPALACASMTDAEEADARAQEGILGIGTCEDCADLWRATRACDFP